MTASFHGEKKANQMCDLVIIHLSLSLKYQNQHGSRSEISKAHEILRGLDSLQELVNHPQIILPHLLLLDAARQHVRDSLLCIKAPADLLIYPCKQTRCAFILVCNPAPAELFEVFVRQSVEPFIEVFGVGDILFNKFPRLGVMEAVLPLRVEKISQNIFRAGNFILSSRLQEFLQTNSIQFVDLPRIRQTFLHLLLILVLVLALIIGAFHFLFLVLLAVFIRAEEVHEVRVYIVQLKILGIGLLFRFE